MRRVCIALALVTAAACGGGSSSPASPGPTTASPTAFADFSGYWSGTYRYLACVGLHCSGPVDRQVPFSLRVRQAGSHVSAVFAIDQTSIEASGDVQADGSLSLSGSESTGGTAGVPETSRLTAPALRLDPALGLTGALRLDIQTLLNGEPWSALYDGGMVSSVRRDLDAYISDLSGTWRGLYRVRECGDAGSQPPCFPFRRDEVDRLELTLRVDGTSATGELVPDTARVPINGRAAGRSIELQGATEPTGVGGSINRVTGFSGTVDQFGRLNGKFTFLYTFQGLTYSLNFDLVHVVKVP